MQEMGTAAAYGILLAALSAAAFFLWGPGSEPSRGG